MTDEREQQELDRMAAEINSLNDITMDRIPSVVRDFLRGIARPNHRTDPVGQALTVGLVSPMLTLSDADVFVMIGRGMKSRYEAERAPQRRLSGGGID